jgi:hypothetical protein
VSQPLSNRILAGALTFLGLGVAWMAIIGNLPSQQELSAKESLHVAPHAAPNTPPEPVLDLSIPGVPSSPQPEPDRAVPQAMTDAPRDRRAAQVARLRCEAEMEQLCPEASGELGRRQCLEKRAQQLPAVCQQQVRERVVRWKEERSRLLVACQADIKRFCPEVRPGGGQQLQCLQEHAQELSDGCYAMLPKGALYFKQYLKQ